MKRHLSIFISLSVLALAIFIKISNFAIVEQIQLKIFDQFQIKHPRNYVQQPIKIIDIDDESLEKIGQWPWPRSILAQIVTKLTDGGAAVIAMDIVYAEEDRTSPKNILPLWNQTDELAHLTKNLPDHDILFTEAISNSNVVTGFVLTQENINRKPEVKSGYSYAGEDPRPYLPNFSGFVSNIKIIEDAANGNGALNSDPDADGILRRVSTMFMDQDGNFYPSLSMEALRVAQGASSYLIKSSGASGEEDYGQATGITAIKVGDFEIPTDSNGKLWVYYTPYIAERYIPVWKVLEPDFDFSLIEGNILFMGTSAAGMRDIRATPLNPTTSGVEVHVQAVEQILSEEYLYRPDWLHGAEIIIMIVSGLVLVVVMAFLPALWGALFTVMALAAAAGFSWYSFTENRMLVDPVTPSIAIIFIYLSESIINYISSEQEKKQVKNAFSHYMSPALVAKLAKNPDSLQLGGETKELTVLFCDIRGFTTISENFDAQGLTQFINSFLTPMTTIILARQGTIDKYMGDCIMAFWNAPLDDLNHAENSCISALEMMFALVDLNAELKIQAKEDGRKFIPIRIGIGLNTGYCCVGNMGSDQRFDYSVLGDDVNLASRLEGQSKTYGIDIIIGENTQKQVLHMASLELDLIQVKGKTKPVRIFTLLGDKELAESKKFQQLKELFLSVLEAYRSQNFGKAKLILKDCYKQNQLVEEIDLSGLFALYEGRIEECFQSPPAKDWDGVFIATSK